MKLGDIWNSFFVSSWCHLQKL